jgi:hypothetical protein
MKTSLKLAALLALLASVLSPTHSQPRDESKAASKKVEESKYTTHHEL